MLRRRKLSKYAMSPSSMDYPLDYPSVPKEDDVPPSVIYPLTVVPPLAKLPLDRQCCVCGYIPREDVVIPHLLRYCTSCRSDHRYCDRACQRGGWKEHKVLCKRTCSFCKTIGSAKLPKCPCKNKRYCNTQCQNLDWKAIHSRVCGLSIPMAL